MTPLERRILDLSYKHQLSHIGSCLTAVAIIDRIYDRITNERNGKFILSCGHAGLALYVVLEKYFGIDAEKLLERHGVHPNLDHGAGIHCSTGSLGQGITIALGMALADRSRNVYCLLSDGECGEGSVYEALHCQSKYDVTNLKIYCNNNGWSAYEKTYGVFVNVENCDTSSHRFMQKYGQEAHYIILTPEQYEEIILQ